jgi:hypothetical protein
MILKYKSFLQLGNFNESQIDENQYFSTGSYGLLESETEAPKDPRLRAYWESFSELRAKQKERIAKAITMVVGKYPFFGDFLQVSRLVWDHPQINTMATDGANIFISSKFASEHTIEQLVFVLVHEIMHITLLHHFRMDEHGAKNARKWNIAGDLEINPYCVGMGIITAQEIKEMDGLYDEKYLNTPVEQIYDKIPDPPKPPKPDSGNPPPPPPPGPIEPEVGDYVRIKKNGEFGKITAKNPDGSWKIEPATEEEVAKAMKK